MCVPYTDLETLEEGQVYDFKPRSSDVEDDSVASQHWRKSLSWAPAHRILGEPRVEEQSINSDSSEGEGRQEPLPTLNPLDNTETFHALHGEAEELPIVENPDTPTRQAIEPYTRQSATSHALEIIKQVERVTGTSGNRSKQPNNQAVEPSSGSSWSHQAVEPAGQFFGFSAQDGVKEFSHYTEEVPWQPLGPSTTRALHASPNPYTIRSLKQAAPWMTVTQLIPLCRFMCELHEGHSAQLNYGVGPTDHWRTRILEGPRLTRKWPPTHPRRTRGWSVGQKTDGSAVGMHTGVVELKCPSQGIYDRRIYRDEMRLIVDANQDRTQIPYSREKSESSQNTNREPWCFGTTVKGCIRNFLACLCHCSYPLPPISDRPYPLNHLDPRRERIPSPGTPAHERKPSRSTVAYTSTLVTTTRDEDSGESRDDGTLGRPLTQVSKS